MRDHSSVLHLAYVPPHDEENAGAHEHVLDDEWVQVGRALEKGVAQDVVLQLEALPLLVLVLADAVDDKVAVAVIVSLRHLQALTFVLSSLEISAHLQIRNSMNHSSFLVRILFRLCDLVQRFLEQRAKPEDDVCPDQVHRAEPVEPEVGDSRE